MPLYTENTLGLFKTEVTYGTDPTPATATDYLAASGITVRPNLNYNSPAATGISKSPRAGTLGTGYMDISFDYEIQAVTDEGSEDFTAAMIALLKASGYEVAAKVYTPVTGTGAAQYDSLTSWIYMDGLCYKITGCRGNVGFTCNSGDPFKLSATLSGLYKAAVDLAFPDTLTDPGDTTYVCRGGTLTIDSYSAVCRSFDFSLNNVLTPRQTIGAASPATQGIAGIGITNRDSGGTMVVEAELLATQDYFTHLAAVGCPSSAQIALSYEMTDPCSETTCTISIPKIELKNIEPGDDSGHRIFTMPFQAVRSSGDDEISITVAAV